MAGSEIEYARVANAAGKPLNIHRLSMPSLTHIIRLEPGKVRLIKCCSCRSAGATQSCPLLASLVDVAREACKRKSAAGACGQEVEEPEVR
jgi:hypothetical protein